MNRYKLLYEMVKTSGLSSTKVDKGLQAMLDTIRETLKDGDSVNIDHFGIFESVTLKQRELTNLRDGSKYTSPRTKRVRFRAWKRLKKAIEESEEVLEEE